MTEIHRSQCLRFLFRSADAAIDVDEQRLFADAPICRRISEEDRAHRALSGGKIGPRSAPHVVVRGRAAGANRIGPHPQERSWRKRTNDEYSSFVRRAVRVPTIFVQ